MTTRRSARAGRISKACRAVVAASLLIAAISLSAITVMSPPAAAAHDLCRVTAVEVTFHNKTGSSLPLSSTRLGTTNAWCALPGNPVGPNSVSRFEMGDNLFKADVNVAYVAPNNDTISLQASSGYADLEAPSARCLVIPNGRAPAAYRCSATVHIEVLSRGAPFGLGTRVAMVDWQVHPA